MLAEVPLAGKYWNYEKNMEDPDIISPLFSKKKNWYWKCPTCSHEWTTRQSFGIRRATEESSPFCPACKQRLSLIEVIDEVCFGFQGLSLFVSDSIFESGDVKADEKYRKSLTTFVRTAIKDNEYEIQGNNENWVLETETIFIRISKKTKIIKQCYMLDEPLKGGKKTGKKGEKDFENVFPQDLSFGTRHPELVAYWDFDENGKSPFEIPDNIQALPEWHWACPTCGNKWSSTRPPVTAHGGCRRCQTQETLQSLLDTGKVHLYDLYADNGKRDVQIPLDMKEFLVLAAHSRSDSKIELAVSKGKLLVRDDKTERQVAINMRNGVVKEAIGFAIPAMARTAAITAGKDAIYKSVK